MFVREGALEAVVGAMMQLVEDWNLQLCGCEAIFSIVSALPGDGNLQGRIFKSGAHFVVAQALRRSVRRTIVYCVYRGSGEVLAGGRVGGCHPMIKTEPKKRKNICPIKK